MFNRFKTGNSSLQQNENILTHQTWFIVKLFFFGNMELHNLDKLLAKTSFCLSNAVFLHFLQNLLKIYWKVDCVLKFLYAIQLNFDSLNTQPFSHGQNPQQCLVITKDHIHIYENVKKWLKASSKQYFVLYSSLAFKFFWTNFGLCRTELKLFLGHKKYFKA